jgi:hypothetical protein
LVPPDLLRLIRRYRRIPDDWEDLAMKHKIAVALTLGGLLATLAGCGESPGTRAVTGGLLGAGAGAGVAAATHGKPATGALVGGGVGAVGGAVTAY